MGVGALLCGMRWKKEMGNGYGVWERKGNGMEWAGAVQEVTTHLSKPDSGFQSTSSVPSTS